MANKNVTESFIKKTDFDEKLTKVDKKENLNRTKHVEAENKLQK